jgi:uncharacterized protein with PIN domain
MTSDEKKKLEILESRVNALVKQQEAVLQRLSLLVELITTQQSIPRCSVCKSPMQRVGTGSDFVAEMWECRSCGESQLKEN